VYCSRHGVAGLVLAFLALAGCGNRAAAPKADRIAVLRFENLSPDGSLSWVGRALSEVVAAQLATAPGVQAISSVQLHSFDRMLGPRPISSPGISSEITQAGLAGATRVVYGEYTLRNGKLEAAVTIEDLANRRMLGTFNVTAPAGNVLGAANEIARLIAPKAGPYLTRSGEALADYIVALESTDPSRMEQKLTAAIQADPDFSAPYRLQAQERLQRGDRAGAAVIVEQALARGDSFPPLERARLEVQAAEISMNLNARHTALQALVKADPNDPVSWRGLGESYVNRHDYRHAVENLQKAVELEPRDAGTWNVLGYAAAYAGDLPAATTALRRYQALLPNGANPLDSLGDVYFASGKLAEAKQFYLDAFQKDPNFLNQGDLLKAAIARLFTGDRAAADQAADRYFDARTRAKDPILEYRRAQWQWLTGRRREAIRQMQAFASANESTPLRDTASRAYAELSLWNLMLGDRAAAGQLAAEGIRVASPQARGNAFVSAFLAMPAASASEWSVRAERAFTGPNAAGIRDFALSYALLVNGEFQAAQLLLKQTWESGAPAADEGLPVILAWTLIETGKPQEAAPLLQFNPVANANGLTPYASFYLPRIFYLRGVLAKKEGRTTDADAEFKKFLALSGDAPLVWGEEKKAQR
jgi:tetratricopeptide (TPR) repeat protein